ncbi:unnamed protein product [Pleuronectes platessa]|uniref:Uncharacterized protein n=1 Tax=Pleuronectes platessa TaxID=8262 RepID=A0A9N7TP32_PLEPL|nr:unnamed protein product [Pleuronectes platessa]
MFQRRTARSFPISASEEAIKEFLSYVTSLPPPTEIGAIELDEPQFALLESTGHSSTCSHYVPSVISPPPRSPLSNTPSFLPSHPNILLLLYPSSFYHHHR